MSSDEGAGPSSASLKKKRLQGACDMCKRKKIKCDSANMPGGICSPCVSFNLQCTHNDPVKKRGPKSVYVAYLEGRIKGLEDQLNEFSRTRGSESPRNVKDHPSPEEVTTPSKLSLRASPDFPHPIPSLSPPEHNFTVSSDEEDLAYVDLLEHTKKLSLNAMEDRFFGPSSAFMFLKSAYNLKKESTGEGMSNASNFKRSKFWVTQSWERSPTFPDYKFPERDLMASLMSLYFTKINCFLPIIHRPTFESQVRQGLHTRNQHFAATVMLVCALGSRYSDDPRVFAASRQHLSSGWKWYEQAQTFRRSPFEPSSLFELQYHCLATVYVHGASSTTAPWTYVGAGLRYAIELGVHRRKPEGQKLTVEDEQRKRAFWVLVVLERSLSAFLGRPASLRDEDFDAEIPVECDDEYWENSNPELAFKQPPNTPARITAFLRLLRLSEISAFAMRSIYPTKKSKVISGLFGNQWEQKIITELDSAMNEWMRSLPEHLQWTPDRTPQANDVFFSQSVYLSINYSHTLIYIHRSFCEKESQLGFSSASVLLKAARSVLSALDSHLKIGSLGLPECICAAHAAGLALISHIWRTRRDGTGSDISDLMCDAQRALAILQADEDRWSLAGRFRDFSGDLIRGLEGAKTRESHKHSPGFEGREVRESWNLNQAMNLDPYVPVETVQYPPPSQPQFYNSGRYNTIPAISQSSRKATGSPGGGAVPSPPSQDSSYSMYPYNTMPMESQNMATTSYLQNGYSAPANSQKSLTDHYGSGVPMVPQGEAGYHPQPVYGQEQQQQSHYISGTHGQPVTDATALQYEQANGVWQAQQQHPQTGYSGYNFNDVGHYIESMAYLNGFMRPHPDYAHPSS